MVVRGLVVRGGGQCGDVEMGSSAPGKNGSDVSENLGHTVVVRSLSAAVLVGERHRAFR